jgi:hypothetical protein
MSVRNRIARGLTRACMVTVLLGVCLGARTAAAWTYPLLPHVQGLAFFPERPNDGQRTSFLLSAVYPDSCWRLVDARMTDSSYVLVAIEPVTTCGDSGSTWTAGWDLGILAAGMHTLTVHATVEYSPTYAREEEISVPFEVSVAIAPPPPPPPGPGIDSVTTLVNYIEVTPGAPLLGDHVSVRFRGRYPFDCGTLADASSADPANLSLTLATNPGCGDSTRVWEHTFDLGVPDTAGTYTRLLHIHVPSLGLERVQGFAYHVTDPNAPPPPSPPPVDSVKAGLSASAPNPFSDRTTFAVSLADPALAEVAVFDLSGRRVTTIHRGLLPRGTSNLAWDGRRQDGSRAAGGIYFYRLTLPERVVTRRVVLLGAP